MHSDEQLAELEAHKRWPDLVEALDERASATIVDPAARCAALSRMMKIYVDRFANIALAITTAERLLELSPHDSDAITLLRETYKKRREHAKLAALEERIAKR